MVVRRGTSRTHARRTHAQVGWGRGASVVVVLLVCLAGCGPSAYYPPMDSAALRDQAARLAVTETARLIQVTQAAAATQQAQVELTRSANEATSMAVTAAIQRAAATAAQATAQKAQDLAVIDHLQASVTMSWLNSQLTLIPVYQGATATRKDEVERRSDQVEDIAGLLLVALSCAGVMGIIGLVIGESRAAWSRELRELQAEKAMRDAVMVDVSNLPLEVWQTSQMASESKESEFV